jgi:hypothetical protein
MGNEDKHSDTDAERQEHRISLEKHAANLDTVPGVDAAQKALFVEFANRDEVWKSEMDKKLVRKIDLRLLPILIILYLLNFLDRYLTPSIVVLRTLTDIDTVPTSPRHDKATSNAIWICTDPTSTSPLRSSSFPTCWRSYPPTCSSPVYGRRYTSALLLLSGE